MFYKIIVLVLLVSAGIFGLSYYKSSGVSLTPLPKEEVSQSTSTKPDIGRSPEDLCESQGGTYAYEVNECVLPLIIVAKPLSGDLISSPFKVSGKARGYWYFEASFPLEITDSAGKVLSTSYASAEGDWMTEEYVPFTGSISFTPPKGGDGKGFVVFKKDNPSGLPENDASVRVPVRF